MKRIQSHKGVVGTIVVNAEGMCLYVIIIIAHTLISAYKKSLVEITFDVPIYKRYLAFIINYK